ncbi:hypothetical protein KALB_1733 [Kutzneria albida DSM 43870]|uniref:Uncharacterized protein n=1 Tax=Kutzneria albida DSM 43870 TaxID=1449976 RepID=W5WA69_9PSEU|nr:hypothetical protein KALB_1733 [Kutzneria albida DSM 43870]
MTQDRYVGRKIARTGAAALLEQFGQGMGSPGTGQAPYTPYGA